MAKKTWTEREEARREEVRFRTEVSIARALYGSPPMGAVGSTSDEERGEALRRVSVEWVGSAHEIKQALARGDAGRARERIGKHELLARLYAWIDAGCPTDVGDLRLAAIADAFVNADLQPLDWFDALKVLPHPVAAQSAETTGADRIAERARRTAYRIFARIEVIIEEAAAEKSQSDGQLYGLSWKVTDLLWAHLTAERAHYHALAGDVAKAVEILLDGYEDVLPYASEQAGRVQGARRGGETRDTEDHRGTVQRNAKIVARVLEVELSGGSRAAEIRRLATRHGLREKTIRNILSQDLRTRRGR